MIIIIIIISLSLLNMYAGVSNHSSEVAGFFTCTGLNTHLWIVIQTSKISIVLSSLESVHRYDPVSCMDYSFDRHNASAINAIVLGAPRRSAKGRGSSPSATRIHNT